MQAQAVVVIGRGVAGISACLAFSRSPGKLWRVVCYDDGNKLAPSRDRYKIARYDYADIETMKLALEACALLQTERYREFCRKKPRLVVYRKNDGTYDQIAQNRKMLNFGERRVLSNKEVWSEFGIKLEEEDTINVLEEDSLLFDLRSLVESMRIECEQNGVQFFDEHVARLFYNDSKFSGVVLRDKREIKFEGAQVWVAAGPWFESLLRDSEMVMPVPERMPTCVQILAFGIEVDAPRSYPIVSILGKGEFMTTNDEDGHGKLTWISTYSRSKPADDSRSYLAVQFILEAENWLLQIAPGIKNVKFTKISSYPDAMTPGEKLIIAHVPSDPSTGYIAGLSFTNAKRVGHLGDTVVKIANGKEEGNPSHGWSPNKYAERQDNQPFLRPSGNFEELNGKAKSHNSVCKWMEKHPNWKEGEDILQFINLDLVKS